MIYKKHELSLSLNGDSVMHIARNSYGNVVFRENSEKALKKAIDEYIKTLQYEAELSEQRKLEKESKKSQVDGAKAHLTGSHEVAEPTSSGVEVVDESIVEEVSNDQETLVPQKRVTRGPDGKFISKNQLDLEEEDKKKTFWDKLTS